MPGSWTTSWSRQPTLLISRRRPALVSLSRIPGLNSITVAEDGALHLGACVSHADVEASEAIRSGWSALADASAIVGSPATRHVGTVGGNLCNGSPAMEIGGP